MQQCSTKGCNRPHHAKDKCHACYTREIRNKKRNVTLRDNCKQCEFLEACPDQAERGSFKCMEIRNKSVTKNVTNPKHKTPTKTPGTSPTTIRVHRFLYYCNYKGNIKGQKIKKKGWYRLNYKDFKYILPIINVRLRLYEQYRWNETAINRAKVKGPQISIYFTGTTIQIGIKHFSWPSVEDMEGDAYTLTGILEENLDIITDNLRYEKMRHAEGHIGRPDKAVESLQERGIEHYKGKTTFNPGEWTDSHPKEIQYNRKIDSERDKEFNKFMEWPDYEEPEERARGAFEGLTFNRFLMAQQKQFNALVESGVQTQHTINAMGMILKNIYEKLDKTERTKADAFLREVTK